MCFPKQSHKTCNFCCFLKGYERNIIQDIEIGDRVSVYCHSDGQFCPGKIIDMKQYLINGQLQVKFKFDHDGCQQRTQSNNWIALRQDSVRPNANTSLFGFFFELR